LKPFTPEHFEVGRVTTVARVKDPDGGPDWALREVEPLNMNGPPGYVAHSCIQLGRIARARFGWVDAANVFRPVPKDAIEGIPSDCGRPYRGGGDYPRLGMLTLVRDLDTPTPRLTRSVVWGTGGAGATRADLVLGTRHVSPSLSRGGAFIAFAPATQSRQQASVSFDRGAPLSLAQNRDRKLSPPPAPLRPVPKIAARAADPNGGLPWGVGEVPASGGGVCVTGGRIIGDRVGRVDFLLGTFDDESGLRYACRRDAIVVQKQVVSIDPFGGVLNGGPQPGDDPARGRIARRTQKGYSTIAGRARADVTSVTLATPHDVRTLPLSAPTRAFIAVYDGTFEGGEVVVTAHFANGSSKRVAHLRLGNL
jgi:hypothetical protein